jgi:hypothetical protein
MKMNAQQLQAFATANQDDAIKLSLAAEADKYKKQHGQEALALMSGQQQKPPIAQQILQNIGQPPQQQPMPQQGAMPPQGMPPQQMAQGQMPPQGMAGGGDVVVPEDQGIATLPVGNMDFAEGGIIGYAGGGVFATAKKKYKQMKGYEFEGGPEMFEKALDAEGIKDPEQRAFLKAIHAQESDQALNAPTRDKSGAMGPMQVTKAAWTDVLAKGDELKSRADPFENMRAGIRYASTGWQKSNGDPVLAGAYYYGGPGGFAKAQKGEAVASSEDKGQTTFQYGKQVASRMPSMIPFVGAATATTAPTTTNPAVSQIPGQSVQAPAAKDESTFFGNIADRMGLSPEVQRNIANTLMAPTPLAPITTLPKAAKSSGIAALGEKIYEKFVPAAGMSQKEIAALRAETEAARAAELAQSAQLYPRLTPPAQVLEQGSQVIPVTKAGEATVQSAADLEKARLAAQATDQLAATQAAERLAQQSAKLPSAAERLQQASYLRESDEAARLMNRARAATDAKTALQTGEGFASIPSTEMPEFEATKGGMSDLNQAFRQFEIGQQNKTEGVQVAKPEAVAQAVAAAKDPETGGTDWNKLAMYFGLNLMAGESPHALTNVGKAGLGALSMQQAEEKAKSERESKMSEAEYRKAMGKYYGAYGEAIERGAKEKNNVALAEKAAQDAVDTWAKNNKMALLQTPDLYEQMRNKYRMEAYKSFGIEPTMAAGAPTGRAKFLGFENPA